MSVEVVQAVIIVILVVLLYEATSGNGSWPGGEK